MSSEGKLPAGEGADSVSEVGDEHPTFDTSVAHVARVYDYWLGGKDNYEADRRAGDAAIEAYPDLVFGVRTNRAFLARVVRYLASQAGIRQFLDIGTGIPTANNTHEVAQAAAPESRIVYVDNDPIVLAHARALLDSTPQGATDYVDADLRDTKTILEQAARTLDFTQPVAVMLIAVMHLIGDDEDPYGIVETLMDAAPPGSYLALSHVASDIAPEQMEEMRSRLNRLMHQKGTYRDQAEVERFFHGLDLVEPGLVEVQRWRPDSEAKRPVAMWVGLGRKR
ncbi:MAG TPA: SAM-dependent methyltransferase [Streptosporangiaceae bacterium]